jgi:hypothetical protein
VQSEGRNRCGFARKTAASSCGAPSRCSACTIRFEPGGDVISVVAKWRFAPAAGPGRRDRHPGRRGRLWMSGTGPRRALRSVRPASAAVARSQAPSRHRSSHATITRTGPPTIAIHLEPVAPLGRSTFVPRGQKQCHHDHAGGGLNDHAGGGLNDHAGGGLTSVADQSERVSITR